MQENGVLDEGRLGKLDICVAVNPRARRSVVIRPFSRMAGGNSPLGSGELVKEDGDAVDGSAGRKVLLNLFRRRAIVDLAGRTLAG